MMSTVSQESDSESTDTTISVSDIAPGRTVYVTLIRKRFLPEHDYFHVAGCSEDEGPSQEKVQKMESLESSCDEGSECEIISPPGHWSNLPMPALEQIMYYLPNTSRLNMACVCKNWSYAISSGLLWRELSLELSTFKQITKPTIKFTQKHARHLHTCVFNWKRPSYLITTRLYKAITEVLNHIKNDSKLQRFRMHYLEMERYWKCEKRREKLLHSIGDCLATQNKLKIFVMNAAKITLMHGIEIFERLSAASGPLIEKMNIEDFFHSRLSPCRSLRFVEAFQRFTNISDLYVNYNCLNDEIIETLTSSGRLTFLSIKVFRHDPHYHKIAGSTWGKLRANSPKLRVTMEFDQVIKYDEIKRILIAELQVNCLYLYSGYQDEENWELSNTLSMIANRYEKSLDSLTMEVENDTELIETSIKDLVLKCKKLNHLDINAVISPNLVEDICEAQIQRKIKLSSLYVLVSGVAPAGTDELLTHLTDKYNETPELCDLDFHFACDMVAEESEGFQMNLDFLNQVQHVQ